MESPIKQTRIFLTKSPLTPKASSKLHPSKILPSLLPFVDTTPESSPINLHSLRNTKKIESPSNSKNQRDLFKVKQILVQTPKCSKSSRSLSPLAKMRINDEINEKKVFEKYKAMRKDDQEREIKLKKLENLLKEAIGKDFCEFDKVSFSLEIVSCALEFIYII